MRLPKNVNVKRSLLVLSFFMLTMFLVACGTPVSGTNTNPTPIPTPTPTPTPIPTTQTYSGDGFTLQYPLNWQATKRDSTVSITPSSNPTVFFSITVGPTSSNYDPQTTLQTEMNDLKASFQNIQPDSTVPQTTTVGGDTWYEGGVTGTHQGMSGKGIVMVDQHPAGNGKIFTIVFAGTTDGYQANSATFKAILDSFTFV